MPQNKHESRWHILQKREDEDVQGEVRYIPNTSFMNFSHTESISCEQWILYSLKTVEKKITTYKRQNTPSNKNNHQPFRYVIISQNISLPIVYVYSKIIEYQITKQ